MTLRTSILIAAVIIGSVMVVAAPAAACPDCGLDPKGTYDYARECANAELKNINDERCFAATGELDPRNWPCTCPPPKDPW